MAWPSANISVANVDAGSDSISSARPQIYQAIANVNEIREFGVNKTDDQTITGNITFTGNTTINEYIEYTYTQGNVSGTFSPNAWTGPVQKITATGNITLNPPTGMSTGSSIVLIIRQDGTGSRRLTANSSYKFSANFRTLSTAANSIDTLSIFYDGTDYLCNLTNGYA
jgi:hypothetical protein